MSVSIHPDAHVSPLADIEASTRGTRFELGAGSVIDSFVKVKPAGGTGDVRIGRNTVINSGCVLYTGNGITIGDNVAIAAHCTLAPVNHAYRRRDLPIREQGFGQSKNGIVIEDDVWIGAGCVLLDGTVLRRGTVIGAMSRVSGEVPEYAIRAGNPLGHLGWRS